MHKCICSDRLDTEVRFENSRTADGREQAFKGQYVRFASCHTLVKNSPEMGTWMPSRSIAYFRVSTERQGRSGLGLEAQCERCSSFAAQNGMEIVSSFTEVETGKGSDALERRPQLAAALAAAKTPEVLRAGGQARPPVARRPLHRRPDGAARAVPRGRARAPTSIPSCSISTRPWLRRSVA